LNDRDAATAATEKPLGSALMGTCNTAALPHLLMLCPHMIFTSRTWKTHWSNARHPHCVTYWTY